MYLTEDDSREEQLTHQSDEEILAYSLKHPSAFSVLLDRYQDAFLRKAYGVVRSKEEAEDIVQETFSKIYANAGRFEVQEGASFKSWGYRILLNTSFTHYQKLKRKRNATADLDPEFYEVLPDLESKDFEKQELAEYLTSIFARMPDHLSKVLRLHFIDGLPQKDIALREGVSVGAIKTRIHRAKKEFKKITTTFA